jgi:hypothetical protein
LEGQPFSEFNKARGPVGGAFPDIAKPKEADVVEDEERERTVDEAAKLVLFLVDTRCGPGQSVFKSTQNPFLSLIKKIKLCRGRSLNAPLDCAHSHIRTSTGTSTSTNNSTSLFLFWLRYLDDKHLSFNVSGLGLEHANNKKWGPPSPRAEVGQENIATVHEPEPTQTTSSP